MTDTFNVSDEETYPGDERREFLRLPYEHPLKFSVCRKGLLKDLEIGTAKNVSQSGMLFKAKKAPDIGTIILLETDLKTLSNCIEVEETLVELNGRIIGKVVRTVPVDEGTLYEVGIQFIRVGQEEEGEISHAIEIASEFTGFSARI